MWLWTKKENRRRFSDMRLNLFKTFVSIGIFSGSLIIAPWVQAQAQDGKIGRVGCPHCRNDGSPISQHLQRADALYDQLQTKEAHAELEKALKLDPENHEALSKLSRVYLEYGDLVPDSDADATAKKLAQYRIAEQYARKAVAAAPTSTWGHFYVAASLGKIASLSSIAKQIDLSHEIKDEVEKAIAQDPKNGFAYHVYGVWHRKVAEIGKTKRALASVVLWRSLPGGDMEKSVEYLKKAVSFNPHVILHHLELAKTYLVLGRQGEAKAELKTVQELPLKFSDDPQNKKEGQKLLQEINR